MANRFPTGIYTEGAVTFDTQPYVNFYTQMQLRKQAKEEALDNYFRDFGKNITPTGMRNQDIPVLTQKNNEWRQFYQQHKAAILNPRMDGGKAYAEYMSRYQDQLGTVQQSKSLADVTKQLGQLRADPKKAELLTEEALENMGYHDRPINDPEHRAFNLNALTYKPPPYDAKMRESVGKMAFANTKPSEVILGQENLPKFQIKTKKGLQYSPEDLQAAGSFAKSLASSDRSAKAYAQNELLPKVLGDPNLYGELNGIYKSVYGKNAESAEDFFAAELIRDSNRKSVKEDVGPDVYGRSVALQRMRHADAKELIALRKKIDPSDQEMINQWVPNYLKTLSTEAKENQPFEYKYKGGKKIYEYDIPIDPVLGKALSTNVGGKTFQPDAFRVDSDGNYHSIFYKYYTSDDKPPEDSGAKVGDPIVGKNGLALVDETLTKKYTPEQVALALGYRGQTKKQLTETMQTVLNKKLASKNSFTIEGKSYTRQQLNKWYSDEEIDEAIKQGLIK